MFFASGLLALLPSIADRINGSPVGYGMLLGGFGCGAVLGALVMQRARSRWSADVIVSAGIAIFGLSTIAAGTLRELAPLAAVMLVGGAAWISFISLFNVQVLNQTPDWVRARVLAVSMLVFQGAVAAGSATWGAVAARDGLGKALLWAGFGTILSTILGLFLRLPNESIDLTPWNHWRLPLVVAADTDGGPVLVTVEYHVNPERLSEFIKAMRQYGRVRRRDGASRWGICRDLEISDRYLETFVVSSWAEHLRQHDRLKQYATWCLTAIHEMLRRERYVGRVVWNRARFIKRPGSNKRVSRPRPKSEWRILDQPELRIVDEDLWARVQAHLLEVKQIYGRGGREGLLNRAASSPCLLTGFLKCGLCGANMVIVTGRGKGNHRRYGCPQNYYRGACSNALKERQDRIEEGLLSGLKTAVLRPEVVDYAVSEFGRKLNAALGDMAIKAGKVRTRREELKAELERLTSAVAEMGHSKYLLQAIADRERELSELVARQLDGPESVQARVEGLRQFVEEELRRVRELLYVDVAKARVELSKHAREIRLVPEGGDYVARGEWDLLGGYAERVRLVAGEGFEPSTFGL